jgi:hypothetical protein
VVDQEIGTRTQHNAAKKACAEELLPPQGDSVLCKGFPFCAKLLISEFSIILSPERGIFGKAPQDGGSDVLIEVQQMHKERERPTPREIRIWHVRGFNLEPINKLPNYPRPSPML